MSLLHFISFLATLLALAFITLCLASGLLYVAEIIEEHSQSAKRIGRHVVHIIIFAHFAIYYSDGLPLGLTLLGVACHLVYLSNFSKSWPIISLTSPSFIASCLLVIVDHFAWFLYFADRAREPVRQHISYRQPYRPAWDQQFTQSPVADRLTFLDVTTFFALCVWLVPFFLFLSLSANDNVLPSLSSEQPISPPFISAQPPTPTKNCQEISYDPNRLHPDNFVLQSPRASLLKGLLQSCLTSLPHVRRHPLHTGGRTSSRPNEGLIASPSISCPSSPSFGWPPHTSRSASLSPNQPNLSATSTSFSFIGRTPPSSPPSSANTPSPRRFFVPSALDLSPNTQKRSTSLRERPSATQVGQFPPPKRRASPPPNARADAAYYNSSFNSITIAARSA